MNRCLELGINHAWDETSPNIVYATFPAKYPDKEETCLNCGLKRWHRSKTQKWLEYSDADYPNDTTPQDDLDYFHCEEIQAYLKERYNLGVFNLSLPFHHIPKNEDSKN